MSDLNLQNSTKRVSASTESLLQKTTAQREEDYFFDSVFNDDNDIPLPYDDSEMFDVSPD